MTALPVERHESMTPRPHPDPAGPGAPGHAELRLAALPTAPSAGRRFVAAHLRKWGLDAFVDACELVVSELVTNAATAAGDPGAGIVLRLRLTDRRLRCEVWDGDEHPPVPAVTAVAGDLAALDGIGEHGRGLLLVAGLCTGWGFHIDPLGGKIVLAWWDLT